MDSNETRIKELETAVKRIDSSIGDLKAVCGRFDTYIAVQQAVQEDRGRHERQQRLKLNLVLTLVGLIVVPVLLAVLFRGVR